MAKAVGESRNQIQRYIRLTNLIPDLLKLTDSGKIAFTIAVELSYLTKEEQSNLLETIKSEECTPSLSQAQQMKKLSQTEDLSVDKIFEIMTQPKANQKEIFKVPLDKVKEFYPRIQTVKEAEDFITKACQYYARYLMRQRDRGDR